MVNARAAKMDELREMVRQLTLSSQQNEAALRHLSQTAQQMNKRLSNTTVEDNPLPPTIATEPLRRLCNTALTQDIAVQTWSFQEILHRLDLMDQRMNGRDPAPEGGLATDAVILTGVNPEHSGFVDKKLNDRDDASVMIDSAPNRRDVTTDDQPLPTITTTEPRSSASIYSNSDLDVQANTSIDAGIPSLLFKEAQATQPQASEVTVKERPPDWRDPVSIESSKAASSSTDEVALSNRLIEVSDLGIGDTCGLNGISFVTSSSLQSKMVSNSSNSTLKNIAGSAVTLWSWSATPSTPTDCIVVVYSDISSCYVDEVLEEDDQEQQETRESDEALQLFEKMQQRGIKPGIETWNSLIRWLCKAVHLTKALEMLAEMQNQGLCPDPEIFVGLIARLGGKGKRDMIERTLDDMRNRGHKIVGHVYEILVDIGGEYGRHMEALSIYHHMKESSCIQDRKAVTKEQGRGMNKELASLIGYWSSACVQLSYKGFLGDVLIRFWGLPREYLLELFVASNTCTHQRQAARIRGLYLKTIIRQDVTFFDVETNTGEVVGRMSGDTVLIQDAMGEKVGKFLQLIATFIGGFVIAFVKGWLLALVMLSAIPPLVIAGATVGQIISKAASRGQNVYAKAVTVVEQTIGSIRTVASFTGEKRAISNYQKFLASAYKSSTYEGLASGAGLGVVMLIIFCSYSLAIWFGGKMILDKGYSGGQVFNVMVAVLIGSMSLGQASPSMSAFAAGQAAAYKMFETIQRKPVIDAYDTKGKVLEDIRGDIELKDVYFSYPARPDEQIFSGFYLSILSGSTTALVGESGSGKSTVIGLIERFYDPLAGEVLIDETNLKEYQLKWYHSFTCMFRDPVGLGDCRKAVTDQGCLGILQLIFTWVDVSKLQTYFGGQIRVLSTVEVLTRVMVAKGRTSEVAGLQQGAKGCVGDLKT